MINGGGGSDNTCPNCGEQLDGEGYCPNSCYEMESEFYICRDGDSTSYSFHIPMTWEEFINSGYNETVICESCGSENKQFYSDGDSVYCLIGDCCGIGHVQLYYDDGFAEAVRPTDEINSSCDYYW